MADEGDPKDLASAAVGIEGRSDRSGTIAAGIFWVVILAIAAVVYFRSDTADVLLEVSTGAPFTVKGSVMFDGAKVTNGQVHLVINSAKDNRYLGSLVIPVDGKDGTFRAAGPGLLPDEVRDKPLRVSARFLGQSNKGKSVPGESVVYINFSPPLGRLTMWGSLGGASVLALALIMLFTGELTRRKARVLFGMTYFMTFFSLAAPIALTVLVSQNVYLVEIMGAAPIGLVKGTAKGVNTAQWLLNIGGAVTAPRRASGVTDPAPASPPPTAGGADSESRATPTVPDAAHVVGGLAVPFYVVFLAMLGAGINMTIQVPKIQNRYDIAELPAATTSLIAATLQAPMAIFSGGRPQTPGQGEIKFGIRRELIGNYMYLLSAPFLAIAVYYLLQVIATNTAEPVLVLMAFSTGLVSDRIISRITKFAEDTLGAETKKKDVKKEEATKEDVKKEEAELPAPHGS